MSATPENRIIFEPPDSDEGMIEGDARWKKLEERLGHPLKRRSIMYLVAAAPNDWQPGDS